MEIDYNSQALPGVCLVLELAGVPYGQEIAAEWMLEHDGPPQPIITVAGFSVAISPSWVSRFKDGYEEARAIGYSTEEGWIF